MRQVDHRQRRAAAAAERHARSTGEVLLDGEDVYAMKPGRLRAVRWTSAAIVFQGALHSLNPVQRVGQPDRRGDPGALGVGTLGRAKARVGELLERVGIPPGGPAEYPHQLSGGQRQRVLIALALACEPKLLIADEPTTALDVMVQAQVLALLAELQRDQGMAMLFITHDLSVLTYDVRAAGGDVRRADRRGGPSSRGVRRPAAPVQPGARRRVPDDRRRRVADAPERARRRPARSRPSCRRAARSIPAATGRSTSCPIDDVQLMPAGDGRRAACVHVVPRTSTVA